MLYSSSLVTLITHESNSYSLIHSVVYLFALLAVGHPGHALNCEPSDGCWWGNCFKTDDVHRPNI